MSVILLTLAVLAIAITVFIFSMDPNKLKPSIIAEVKKQTGYNMTIDGRLTWSLYPLLGIKIEHMTLTAPSASSPFLDLRGVNIASEFKQILRGTQKLKGDVRIDDMRLAKLHMQNAYIGIDWQNQMLTLMPVKASLYDGKLDGVVHGSHLFAVPRWDWNMHASSVQIKPLLADVSDGNTKLQIDGLGEINMKAETQGKTKDSLLMNLNGNGNFALHNGSVLGTDINFLIESADALMSRRLMPTQNMNQTQFDNLSGSFMLAHGSANISDLQLLSSAFTIKGDGNINLLTQNLDLQLAVSSLKTTTLKGTIPLLVQGDLHSPSVRLDMNAVNAMITREQINKAKAKIQEHVKGLSDKADKFLQKLIGQ